MKVLITGGAGFIGSTIANCCADHGIEPIILDDFSTGLRQFAQQHEYYEGDIADRALIQRIFTEHSDIYAVIHCAAKIVVPESVEQPLKYYENNVAKAVILLEELRKAQVSRFIFSSTAALYDPDPEKNYVVDENTSLKPLSPYSYSKFMFEQVMKDLAHTGVMKMLSLRYFNPIGADPQLRSGLQLSSPTHALGKIFEAYREDKEFIVTGTEWNTRDGSGLRDYIHVWDLAEAHVAALRHFDKALAAADTKGYQVINLGTEQGVTVFELVAAFEKAVGVKLKLVSGPSRMGDVLGSASSAKRAYELLGWKPLLSIEQGIIDSLTWSRKLPEILGE